MTGTKLFIYGGPGFKAIHITYYSKASRLVPGSYVMANRPSKGVIKKGYTYPIGILHIGQKERFVSGNMGGKCRVGRSFFV